jgi:hypothetical protein
MSSADELETQCIGDYPNAGPEIMEPTGHIPSTVGHIPSTVCPNPHSQSSNKKKKEKAAMLDTDGRTSLKENSP